MSSYLSEKSVCTKCGAEHPIDFRFCSHCGTRNALSVKIERRKGKLADINIKSILSYSFVLIVTLIIAAFTEESFEFLVFWTVGFAIIDLGFAAYQPSVYKLFNLGSIKILPLLSIVIICIATGVIVSFSMDKLNLLLYGQTETLLDVFYLQDQPLLYSIIIIAVFPAIFEEIAFRGFIFNNFKFLGGLKAAFWGSSFLFALVHFSMIGLIWIIPFALLLSFYRNKYNTLIYGVIGHFIHNSVAVLIEYYAIF